MRRLAPTALSACLATLGLAAFAVTALPGSAEAQGVRRQRGDVLILNVRPRSFLDAGRVAPVGSENRYAGGWQVRSYLNSPPYANLNERYGGGVLPDPIIGGPFVGARNPFGPVDYVAPAGLR